MAARLQRPLWWAASIHHALGGSSGSGVLWWLGRRAPDAGAAWLQLQTRGQLRLLPRCADCKDGAMSSTTPFQSYEQACEHHRWEVPERYNIAADVCDRHPREKLAMIHEDFAGDVRARQLGRAAGHLQPLRQRAGRASASDAATGWRCCCRRRPRPPRRSSGPGRPARFCCRCRCSTATRGSATGSPTRRRRCSSPMRENADRIERALVEHVLVLDDALLATGSTELHVPRHLIRGSRAALLHLRHHRPGQGHPPRPPLHPRPRGVHLLPRRP